MRVLPSIVHNLWVCCISNAYAMCIAHALHKHCTSIARISYALDVLRPMDALRTLRIAHALRNS